MVVLVWVKKENGRYRMTADQPGAIGHFLLVESINFRSKKVKLAGSTLGMDEVPITDFIQSWTGNPNPGASISSWRTYLTREKAVNWALILKRS